MVSAVATTKPAVEGRDEEQRRAALIGRIAQSDQAALGELYDATSGFVHGLVCRIVGDRAAAEEITLDVYTQVWRLASSYSRERGAPTAWLLMLARSRAIDFLRSRARRTQDREQPINLATAVSDPAPSPEQAVIESGLQRVVQAALAGLGPEQREAIELAFYSGMSHREIAARTGQPLGTIKTRIRVGMLRLRDILRPCAEGQ